MESAIKLEGIWKSYGKSLVLQDITLDVKKGEIFVLLGRNGSGKSTLLRAIAGLLTLDSGQIDILGRSFGRNQREIRKLMGVVFDQAVHWDALSGYENAYFFAKSYGTTDEEAQHRLNDLLRWSGLWEKKDDPVSTYSYGMRRKLALVEALAHKPSILLLDEPSMGLDYSSRLALYNLLKAESNKGATIILASNDVAEAAAIAERISLINQGKVAAIGKPSELMTDLDARTRIELKLAVPISLDAIREMKEVEMVEMGGEDNGSGIRLLVKSDPRFGLIPLIIDIMHRLEEQGGVLQGIEIKEPDLGDLFMKLTGHYDR